MRYKGVYFFFEDEMTLADIFSFENLYEAYKNCRKGKQHKGEVIRFKADLAYNINKI